jgi:hypothetical protein
MEYEIVYLGHDNSINLILKADAVAVPLAGVTRITIAFGATVISSTNLSTDPILWAQASYATGEVRLFLGAKTIAAETYEAQFVVYDAANPNGIVWANVPIVVK